MIHETDARIPDASTPWQLWYSDTFDRESSPSVEASGKDILRGLYELWRYTLNEGIQENGSASFSYFYLTWGQAAFARIDVAVKPFDNRSLLKLRDWTGLKGEEPTISVLSRLAQLHYELLQSSDRWGAAAIDWSAEARELLARVELITDPEEL